MKKGKFFFIVVFIFIFIIRLFILDQLPGEWFGDISNVHEYTSQILKGQWPFYIFQSPGPLYHYLIAPLVLLFQRKGYLTYKFASVFVSLLGLLSTYLFVKELFAKKLALLTLFTMGISFWYLVWSRLGNSQILIPFLSSFSLYFFVRLVKGGNLNDLFFYCLFSFFGLYTYPQTFVFFPCFFYF